MIAIALLMLAMVLVISTAQQVRAATNATISTNQSDYPWFSTVYIYGSGFVVLGTVHVSVTDPNGAVTAWTVTSDFSGSFATTYTLGNVSGYYTVFASDGTNSATTTFHDADIAGNLDQCRNGGVNGPYVACSPSTPNPNGWVNGNAGGSQAHWREGEFISYRDTLTLNSTGTWVFRIQYDTVHSGKHAIDYLGSFDATETTSSTPSQFHANNNDPCTDRLGTTDCTPGSPQSSFLIPAATLVNCANSVGTIPSAQVAGSFKLWSSAPGKVSITGVSYPVGLQNLVSGTGQCSTSVDVTMSVTSGALGSGGTVTVVLAWGGHIASQADWGFGNSASAISGSPYHMAQEDLFLNGVNVNLGAQDRSLATSAVFFTPSITTVVQYDSNNNPVVSPIPLGTSVHDNATLTNASSVSGGTVTYHFWTNIGCSGTPLWTKTVTVTHASVPNSNSTGPLAAGSYSFNATYSGDSSSNTFPAFSACEPFTVGKKPTTIFTNLILGTSTPLANGTAVALGSSVHDTATVTGGVSGVPITGTVTYHFYTNGTCTAPSKDETVTISSGSVPPSSSHGPLVAGSYSFNATYSGDANYAKSDSACEPFSVGKAPTTIFTNLILGTSTPLANGSTIALGSTVHDTSTVTGQVGSISITGTVTYRFFTNGTCSAPPFATWTVSLGSPSGTVGPLGAGSYSFNASYSGDSNYKASYSSCEPFSVGKAPTTIFTNLVLGTSTPLANGSTIALGSSVHDTSTVTGQVGSIPITGTVTYRFFTNGTCSAPAIQTWTVSLGSPSGTVGPLAAGDYSFNASYSGDGNYLPSFSSCEPFHVGKASTTIFTNLVLGTSTPLANGSTIALSSFVHDTSTVTGQVGSIPLTGTVTYRFFTNGTCSAPAIATWTVPLGDPSGTVGPLATGSYSFNASYSGDSNYEPSFSSCEPFSVGKASTTIFTNLIQGTNTPLANDSTIALGSTVHDTSTVTGQVGSFPITGTVTYRFFTNGTCSAPAFATWTVPVGDPSGTVGPLAAGDYSFNASYSGNKNYLPSFSDCEPFHVAKGPTTIFTNLVLGTSTPLANGSTIALGSSVHDTSTVTGQVNSFAITGTVTYRFFTNGSCSDPAFATWTVPVGDPSGTVGPLATGSYSFNASYSGDSNYLPSFSDCEPFSVGKAPTTIFTNLIEGTSTPLDNGSTVTLGSFVHDTSTVTGQVNSFAITGTVTYRFFTNGTCSAPAFATFSVSVGSPSPALGPLGAGDYSFNASYSGNGNYLPSFSDCEPFSVPLFPGASTDTLVINDATNLPPTGTEVTGASFHDTATVTGISAFTPTGTVTYEFFTNGTCSAPPVSTEQVTMSGGNVPDSSSTGPLPAGSYSFDAIYSGDSNYQGSTSACEPFSVAKAPTTVFTNLIEGTSTPLDNGSTVALGSFVHDTSTVTGQVGSIPITGTVTYRVFTNGTCSAPAFATFSVSVGSPSPALGPLGAGDYSFNASYSGNGNYLPSFSDCEPFHVAKGPTTVFTNLIEGTNTPLANGSTIGLGSSVHDTSTVTGEVDSIPITGTVTYRFFTNGTCSAPAFMTWTVPVGSASPNVGPLGGGSYSFNASYSGDSNYSGSFSDCEPFSVGKAPTTIFTNLILGTSTPLANGTTVAQGSTVHDTSTVTGGVSGFPITGTVTYRFFTNGTCSAPAFMTWTVPVGSASPNVGPLGGGSYSFNASYSGDSNYSGSFSDCEPFAVTSPPTVTDTTFCPVSQFRLIFIQDTGSGFTLTASNPGQFYSNLFVTLASPGTLSVSLNIPYPFVTQGAVPIQVFYNQPIPTCGSTVPSTNVNGEFTISPTSINLASYGSTPTLGVTTVTVNFGSTGTLPAGLYWFAIHLNYGLKGLDFTKVQPGQTTQGNTCVGSSGPCAQGAASYNFIDNPQSYAFSNSVSGSTPITSVNHFNKDPGFAGVVTDSTGTPIPNVPVSIYVSGKLKATVSTNGDGVYMYQYKYTGSPTSYTVTASYNGASKSVSGTLKANALIVVNFTFP